MNFKILSNVPSLPAEISQPNVALLARRIYGCHMLVSPKNVYQRISGIEKERYTGVLEQLLQMNREQLTHTYTLREQEPQDNQDGHQGTRIFPRENLPKTGRICRVGSDLREVATNGSKSCSKNIEGSFSVWKH
jgi:hypothetical protein